VVGLAGKPVASLQGYSAILRTLSPGQATDVVIERNGEKQTIAVRLGER
jgi:S1-C subfamily serine protease